MAASWLHAPKRDLCMSHIHTYLNPLSPHHIFAIALLCPVCVSVRVFAGLFVYSWTYVCPVRLCSLPHPGGLASVLHRRCSSLPQSHLAPLSKRPPPLQACIPTTSTSTSTSVIAPHLPPTVPKHDASTLPKKELISFFFFSLLTFLFLTSYPTYTFLLHPLFPPTPYFVNCFIYHYFYFILSTLHVVCLA